MAKISDLIDVVAGHLTAQKKQSITASEGMCVYRHTDGSMCAVGYLIPNEMYSTDMECNGADELLTNFPEVLGHFRPLFREGVSDETIKDVLSEIQFYHDRKEGQGVVCYVNDLKRSVEEGLDDGALKALIIDGITTRLKYRFPRIFAAS